MKQELIKNTLIIGAGRVMTQFIGLILLPLYTIFLSPDEYGTGDLVITYAALALPFATLSLEQGAFRLLVDARENSKRITEVISFIIKKLLLLLIPLSIIILFVGGLLELRDYLLVVALTYVITYILLNVSQWFARGFGNNFAYSIGSILVGISSLILNLVLVAYFNMGVVGMLGALSLAQIVGVTYFFIALNLSKFINFNVDNKEVNKELLQYSLPLVPNSISWWLISVADRTIIAIFLGVAATGIYAVAAKFPAVLIGIFSVFWISWHESASIYINHKEKDEFFTKVANTTLMLFGTIALLIIASLSVVFPFIVESDFQEAYLYVPILMLGALCSAMITLYGSIYAAKKTTRQILNTTLLAALINLVVMISLIQVIDLFAAAVASVVAYLSMLICRHVDIKKYVIIQIDLGKVLRLVLFSTLVIAIYYFNSPYLNIANVVFVVVVGFILNKNIIFSVKEMIWKKRLKF